MLDLPTGTLVSAGVAKGKVDWMEWTRSETLALAMHHCTHCHGSGLRLVRKGALAPCNCVLRAIFRVCYSRFVTCVTQERHLSQIALGRDGGRSSRLTWGRKDEEYIADFCLVSRRTLDDFEYKLFRYHFLLGADWRLCTRRLGLERGNFFHAVYRIEQKLGRMFRELQPYSLYPLDEYFHGTAGGCGARALAPKPHGPPVLPEHLRFPQTA
jgi:hypothetical protein